MSNNPQQKYITTFKDGGQGLIPYEIIFYMIELA